jgi:hypothetical protein
MHERVKRVRELYLAFAAGDRGLVDGLLGDEFTFSSPIDVGLDRADISSGVGQAPVRANSLTLCGWSRMATK